MDLKYLNTFRAIVNEGSFSEAARKLNYTQSTITFQIGQLEQELSVRLFDKIGRKMVLTKAGEQLIPYVDEVLQSVDRLQTFQNNLSQYQGNLHIGVGETLLCYLLPDKLKTFHQSAPNVQLYLQSLNCYEIHDKVLNGSLTWGSSMKTSAESASPLSPGLWELLNWCWWLLLRQPASFLTL